MYWSKLFTITLFCGIGLLCETKSYSQTFVPSNITGLSLWLSTDSGLVMNGGTTVQQWNDRSKNDNHALQNTGNKQPAKVNNNGSLNNYPIIHFDGNDDFLAIRDTASLDFTNKFTTFIVFKQTAVTIDQAILCKWDYPTQGSWALQTGHSSNPEMTLYKANSLTDDGSNSISTLNANRDTNFSILALVYDGTQNNSVLFFKNSIQLNTSTEGIITPSLPNASASLKIGKFGGIVDRYFKGDIAEIIVYNSALSTTDRQQVEQYLHCKYAPPVNLGSDIAVNYGFCDTTIDAGQSFVSYIWSTGDTTSSIFVNKPGTYWVSATDVFGYYSSDTVNISYPEINNIPATYVCLGDSIVWNAGLSNGYTFLWQDGSVGSSYTIKQQGNYSVKVTDFLGCFKYSDTVTIDIDSFPITASLGPDTSLCTGNSIFLKNGASGVQSYLWNDGSTNSSLSIQNEGQYRVNAINSNGCTKTDTINIDIKGVAPTVDFSVTPVCKGDSTIFTDSSKSSSGTIINWLWNFGDGKISASRNPTHLYTQSNTYPVTLTVTTDFGCFNSNTKNYIVYPFPIASFSNVPPVCSGATINFKDNSKISVGTISNWQWNFGDTTSGNNNTSILQNSSHAFNNEGEYYVKLIVTSNHGCKDSTINFMKIFSETACFNPNQWSGLKLWLMGDSVDSHNSIGTWYDLSGNNNHAIQTTSTNQPLFINNITKLNKHSVVQFDGNDVLEISDNASIDFTNKLTVFIIFKQPTVTIDQAILSKWDYQTQGSWALQTGHSSGTEMTLYKAISLTDDGSNSVSTLNANRDTNFSILAFVYDGTQANSVLFFKNSIQLNTSTVGTITPSLPNSSASLKIGKFGGIIDRYFKGDIAEIIVYDTSLTIPQRQQVEQYLRYKYAPPVNLGPDIVLKNFCDTTLDANSRFISYKWHTIGQADNPADTTRIFKTNKTGRYWVEVTDVFGFQSSDTVNVTSPLNQLTDATICYGDTLVWNTGLKKSIYTFQWQDGSNDSLYKITKAGKYWVKVTDTLGCFLSSDTITIAIDSFPITASLGTDTSLCTGNTISLKSGASGVQSYLWSDGSIKSSLSIQKPAQYWVKAVNSNGCIKQDTITIAIKGTAPIPLFSTDSITCQKNKIQFTDSSTVSVGNSIVGWSWDFGDTTTSNLQNPTHLYSDTGNYAVALTVTANTGCSNTSSKNIKINPLPVVNFNTMGACSKTNIQLNDLSSIIGSQINSWKWNFGDAASGTSNSSILQNPIHIYTDSGNYTIQLIAQSTQGCRDSTSKNLYIKPSPIANFTTTLGCKKDSVIFTNTSVIPSQETISSHSWNFGNGKTSTLPNPGYTYSDTGIYTIKLSITVSNGCKADSTKALKINDKPFADYIFSNNCLNSATLFKDKSTVNNDSITAWNWKFNSSDTSLFRTPSYTFRDTGNYPVRLLITSSAGCKDSVIKNILVKPLPIANFTFNPMFGEPPLNVNFTNKSSGASKYSWDFGDGKKDTLTNPIHLFQDTGRYTIALTATDNTGCFSPTTTQLLQVSPASIDIALLDVKTSIDKNNYLSISIGMLNKGTRTINYVELLVKADGNLAIKETWNGTLNVGEYTTYNFSSSIQLAENNSYVCISLANPNFTVDDVPGNNEQCFPLRKDVFIVPDPFPNPVSGDLTIPFIVPSDGEAQISLFDMKADVAITNFKVNAIKGYNQLTFKTTDLAPGVYAYSVSFNGEKIVKRFIKVRAL